MSGHGVPPPKNDPLPEIKFSKGKKGTVDDITRIQHFYEMARKSKGNNRQMWLAQVLDSGMDYCSKCKENEKSAKPIKEACGYALGAIHAAGESTSNDPSGQRALGPNYKTEAALYAQRANATTGGFTLAYAHGDSASYPQARKVLQGNQNDQERLKAIGVVGAQRQGVADDQGLEHAAQVEKRLKAAGLWKPGIMEEPAMVARATFQKDYVVYLRKQRRKEFEVRFADGDGTVAQANWSDPKSDLPMNDGEHMFAMRTKVVKSEERVSFCAADVRNIQEDRLGEKLGLKQGADFDGLHFNHSSFFKGKPVTCAGVLKVEDNRIVDINNLTGHYKSTPDDLQKAVEYLHKQQGKLPENMTVSAKKVLKVKGKDEEVMVRWLAREFREKGEKATATYSMNGTDFGPPADLPTDLRRAVASVWEQAEQNRVEPKEAAGPKIGRRAPAAVATAAVAGAAAPPAGGEGGGNG